MFLLFFSVQYVIHLYGYLREWRKNPRYSFSCCLALVLPLVSLPGDISGLVGTNIVNNQLQTRDIEMPTIGAAVQDSGALDVALEEGKQGVGNRTEAQGDNRGDAQPNNGKKITPINAVNMQERGGSYEEGKHGDQILSKMHKFHQKTQTTLSTIFSVANVVAHGPMKEEHF